MTVTLARATDARAQGLVVDADHDLGVNDITAKRVVLWSDTAPDVVEIRTSDRGAVRFWNVWRDDELVQSWQGVSRIEVDDDGEDLGLACHDGHGDGGVDLEVRVSFDRAWTQPESAAPADG
ncbi:MAG: hypothetical protein DHS20C19_01120 [Acidimicrobiales bacterium]|nr:MAG: hypothetical protein DHS20C19_01120 [Acidimicrobiales bacterium]